jgi:hypothetical protein
MQQPPKKSSHKEVAGLSEATFFRHVQTPSDMVSDVAVALKSRVHAGPQRVSAVLGW